MRSTTRAAKSLATTKAAVKAKGRPKPTTKDTFTREELVQVFQNHWQTLLDSVKPIDLDLFASPRRSRNADDVRRLLDSREIMETTLNEIELLRETRETLESIASDIGLDINLSPLAAVKLLNG